MRWVVRAALAVPVLLLVLLLVVFSTAAGARFVVATLADVLPALSVGETNGALRSALVLKDVRFATSGGVFEAQRLALRWQPSALLRREFRVLSVSGNHLRYTVLPTAAAPDTEPVAGPIQLPQLPVAVTLERLVLEAFELVDQNGTVLLQISSADLSAAMAEKDAALALRDLTLETPALAGQVSARGTLLIPEDRTFAASIFDGEIDYRLVPKDAPLTPVAGVFQGDGPINALALRNTLSAPYYSELEGTLTDVLGEPAFDLSLRTAALNPLLLNGDWPEGAFQGELQLQGTVAAWALSLDVRAEALQQWVVNFAGQFQGGLEAAEIRSLIADTSFGRLAATGEVAWQDGVTSQVALGLEGFEPQVFAEQWPGTVAATLDVDLQWPDPADINTLAADLSALKLDGELRGAALGGALEATLRDGRLTVAPGGRLAWGANTMTLSGSLDPAKDSAVRLAPQLQELGLLPELGFTEGSIAGELELAGSFDAPRARGTLKLEHLAGAGFGLEAAAVDFALDSTATADQRVEVTVTELASEGAQVASATFALRGPLADHEVNATVASNYGSAVLGWRGEAQRLPTDPGALLQFAEWWTRGGVYRWQAQALTLEPTEGPRWSLSAGGAGEASAAALSLTNSCLAPEAVTPGDDEASPALGAASLCLAGSRAASGAVAASYVLRALPLALAQPWLDPQQRLDGTLAGEGALRFADPARPRVAGTASLALSDLRLAVQGIDPEAPQTFVPVLAAALGGIQLRADGDATRLTLDLPLTVFDPTANTTAGESPTVPGSMTAALALGNMAKSWDGAPLAGQVELQLDSVRLIETFSDEVLAAAGRLDGRLDVGGTLAAPVLDGQLRWLDGALALKTPGLDLEAISLALTPGAAVNRFDLEATLQSGPGQLSLTGSLGLDESGGPVASMRIAGTDVLFANTAEARVLASPALDVAYGPDLLTVRGTVALPEASVALQQFPPSAVTSSKDAIIVRDTESTAVADSSLAIDAEVQLLLGDAVSFKGFGLETRMTGELTLRQRPGRPALGRGEIALEEGEFRAYGQNLAIERGVALWTNSPIAEPGIDLRAYRLPRPDIKVGVSARGSLAAPRTSLFSEPSMPESDQLSYLVLGRPLEDNSSSEQSMLSQAALALGIRGGNFLSKQFGDKLGVDQIGIESEAGAGAEQAAFVVGKYLSPALYVSYGVGLLDAVSRLKMEYFLSRRWTLQTESSTLSSGGDLIYRIERK